MKATAEVDAAYDRVLALLPETLGEDAAVLLALDDLVVASSEWGADRVLDLAAKPDQIAVVARNGGAEAELLALRLVVEAAVASVDADRAYYAAAEALGREWDPNEGFAGTRGKPEHAAWTDAGKVQRAGWERLGSAVDAYRALSGQAASPIPSVCRCGHPESVHVTGGCSAPTGNHIYDTTCPCRGWRADADPEWSATAELYTATTLDGEIFEGEDGA